MITNKPVAESCLQNQVVILEQIKNYFKSVGKVLEIGAGTGQHAIFFAEACKHLTWYPSDISEYLEGMKMWFDEAKLDNVQPPCAFDINLPSQHPKQSFDYIFTANTLHIMSYDEVVQIFYFIGKNLKTNGRFLIYGPFNYNGNYTSLSNENFDTWLKQLSGDSSIKHFEDIEKLANLNGLNLVADVTMPANNRVLVWQKLLF